MRKNVLIYPGNSYPAEEVYHCLEYNLRYRPIVGNHGDAHFRYVASDDFVSDLPLITDEFFFDILNRFIEQESVSFIIPTHDTVAEFLMQNEERIGCTIACSCAKTAIICRHKSMTYELFCDCSFSPRVYQGRIGQNDYPVFVKDDMGQGGKNSGIAHDAFELDALTSNHEIDYVITEYLPGDEITVDCFTDRHGSLLISQPRIRETILVGMSGRSRILACSQEIRCIADTLNERLSFRGYWYFQCKQNANGEYKLMEVSTRFAGTFCVTKNLDVNFPVLMLTDLEGIDVQIVPNDYSLSADRGYVNCYKVDYDYDTVYLDFDDTLVANRETYIVPAMAFLYQCKNQGKEVCLITRHAHDLNETMEKLHISLDLFDEIVKVGEGERKVDSIDVKKKSIFVDNSFAERYEVKTRLGIPTFDVCNLECIMEPWH